MYETLNYSTELCHHGILGQRWGIRRFQNKDGSLTEAGKKKYGSEDYQRVKELEKRDTKTLSNDELRQIAERRQLEKQIKKGDVETQRMLIQYGTKVLTTAVVATAAVVGAKYVANNLPNMAKSLARSTAEASMNITKTAAKKAANDAWDAGHNIRKAAAKSQFAKSYVKTIRNIVG